MKLTAIILTYNEEKHIGACIESLAWADRVVVFDSHSQDGTVALAEAAGATTYQHPFQNYAQQRNAALDAIRSDEPTDWVLFIDADERGTAALGAEIRRVMMDEDGTAAGYYIPRHNYIFGKLTLGAGWWPDHQQRLFRYGRVRYERPVHEIAVVDGTSGHLESPLIHYNYETVVQFHAKQKKYTAYEAGVLRESGIRPKFYTPFTQPVRHFIWRFITLDGYKLGWHGFRLSLIMAYYEWRKYRLLKSTAQRRTAG